MRELVATKAHQVEQMSVQLDAVVTAKKSLQDLITSLFDKIERITKTKHSLHTAIQHQQEISGATLQTLQTRMETLRSGKEELDQSKKRASG